LKILELSRFQNLRWLAQNKSNEFKKSSCAFDKFLPLNILNLKGAAQHSHGSCQAATTWQLTGSTADCV
jgi:hypothetical protein